MVVFGDRKKKLFHLIIEFSANWLSATAGTGLHLLKHIIRTHCMFNIYAYIRVYFNVFDYVALSACVFNIFSRS